MSEARVHEPFDEILEQMQQATEQFLNGDATLWKSLCCQTKDVTIAGGWGHWERGWDEVGARYDWAEARFVRGHVHYQPVAMGASGDLAYTFGIERSRVRLAGASEDAPMALRVTHIYRWERGCWKLLHRHADPLMSKEAAEFVIHR